MYFSCNRTPDTKFEQVHELVKRKDRSQFDNDLMILFFKHKQKQEFQMSWTQDYIY